MVTRTLTINKSNSKVKLAKFKDIRTDSLANFKAWALMAASSAGVIDESPKSGPGIVESASAW